jgi:UDP-glucuronate decarboxylase
MTVRASTRKTALVAGGAGFLGSYLCERLVEQDWRVICLDNLHTGRVENLRSLSTESRFSLIEADVTSAMPERLHVDRIYNLACPASPPHYQADPVHTLLTSVLGMRNLLELARHSNARVLQTSTSEVYGDPAQHPQTETYWGNVNPIGIRACYDEGKRAAETLCFDYQRQYGVSVRVARIFNTYGPRMRPDDGRIVSNLIVQAISGQKLTIYGSGEQTRSFCYVSDLIEGLSRLMALDHKLDMPVNLGNPEEYSINELAELIRGLTRSESGIEFHALPADDPRCRRPDITRAKALLDWAPRVPVLEGLQATIEWFLGGEGDKAAPALDVMTAAG